MSGLSRPQLAVARLLFGLPEARGFALAGGSALLALGAIDRPTRDIDAFIAAIPEVPPGDVLPLLAALRRALRVEGWKVAVERDHQTFARCTASRAKDAVEIDLAVDSPPLFPLEAAQGLPVLAGQDLAARKVLAILDRAEGRDFTDLRALADRYSKDECIEWAQQLDRGATRTNVADAFGQLARLDDTDLPCVPTDRLAIRAWFAEWAHDIRTDS